MGRTERNVVEYFPHRCTHGKTMFILNEKHPIKGYYVWFRTLELLGCTENHFIDCRQKTDWQYLSASIRIPESELLEIYDTLADLGSIHPELWENRVIWSLNFIMGIKDVYRKRNRICMNFIEICDSLKLNLKHKYSKNGIIDTEKHISGAEINIPVTEIRQSKVKESKVKESIKKEEVFSVSENPKQEEKHEVPFFLQEQDDPYKKFFENNPDFQP